ncbi:MAG: hypothetical protein QGG17_01685 [Rhodospirillales bacterium]|jgi:hypothetical protein|nr:hypothetical protein [Rhodospirillales bacterium]
MLFRPTAIWSWDGIPVSVLGSVADKDTESGAASTIAPRRDLGNPFALGNA